MAMLERFRGQRARGEVLRRALAALVGGACLALATAAQAALLGPSTYASSADSPFFPFAGYSYFHLEDFEDGSFNVPGVTAAGGGLCITGVSCGFGPSVTDSVENGSAGHNHWASGSITYTFDAAFLGALPTDVGIVWTDGSNPITFQAYDAANELIGTLVGNHADGTFASSKGEDRFYGATNAGGIFRIVISSSGGIEADHLQYGLLAIPEPQTYALLLAGLALLGFVRRSRSGHRHSRASAIARPGKR